MKYPNASWMHEANCNATRLPAAMAWARAMYGERWPQVLFEGKLIQKKLTGDELEKAKLAYSASMFLFAIGKYCNQAGVRPHVLFFYD